MPNKLGTIRVQSPRSNGARIKDVEWLTVQLADNSEEITTLEREIDESEKDPNTNPERLDTLQ